MKPLLLCIVLTIVSYNGYTQTAFAPPGAMWHFGATPYDYWYGRAVVAPSIGGMTCASINMYEHQFSTPTYARGQLSVCTSATGDTIYYWRYGKQVPLYIFNVKAGDTVGFNNTNYSNPDTLFHVRIDSVKPQLWGGALLRTVWGKTIGLIPFDVTWCSFSYDTGSQILYVERLGAINGNGLLPWKHYAILESPGGVTCYYDGTTDMRKYGYDSCLGTPAGILSEALNDHSIRPNPVTGYCNINLNRPLIASTTLLAYDMSGRLQYAKTLPAGSKNAGINMLDWPAGIYVLILAAGDDAVHVRVLKQ